MKPSMRGRQVGASAARFARLFALSGGKVAQSVGAKLFIILLVSIVALVVVVGGVSYSVSGDVIQKQVSKAATQAVSQAMDRYDLVFKNYETMTTQILVDKDLQSNLDELKNNASLDAYGQLEKRRKIEEIVNRYFLTDPTLASIVLFDDAGQLLHASGTVSFPKPVKDEPWFKQAESLNGKAVWLESKPTGYSPSGGIPSFGIARQIRSTMTSQVLGMLLVEIRLSVLSDSLAALELAEGSRAFMVGPSGRVTVPTEGQQIEGEPGIALNTPEGVASGSDRVGDKLVVWKRSAVNGWILVGTIPVASLVKDTKTIFNLTVVMVVVAVAVAVAVGAFVVWLVGVPLMRLRNLMQEGARGNLTVRMPSRRKDEIGQVTASFNQMMDQITELVRQSYASAEEVKQTAVELAEASRRTERSAREIAAATEEIASGATSLALEAEKGNDITYQIGEQMKQVIASNFEMGKSAAEVRQSSEQGTEYLRELIGKTNDTEKMMRQMSEKVEKLNESARSIRKILDLLENITKQTNILALNATIEAARAGTAGRGFMVVADEIRKLADQSRQSIDVVGQLIETIRREMEDTVQTIAAAHPIFEEQVRAVHETDAIFGQVRERMAEFIRKLDETSASIAGLEQSQQVLTAAMANVSAVAEQSSANSEEVASLSAEQTSISGSLVEQAEKLERLSDSLREQLAKFRIA
ncbi:MAG: hypothetical protein BLM47_04555 [Candidatus Reconcilbacillus cellulovorans]|uniref:Methyl-accepting chemotaxis protein n=1 Tax=Candidatus Reconcilbacillus cellulovorans TaxID=1906605 RepID=A0A2A6E1W9_9BACL|nr:MAG: hypothetical protein BLM47_04555 [Candidatus Reconcilbacillus cellulovorans]